MKENVEWETKYEKGWRKNDVHEGRRLGKERRRRRKRRAKRTRSRKGKNEK
jgi:hypothetical protein